MKITLYLSDKDRERNIGGALAEGFAKHGETVQVIPTHEFVRPDWETQLAVVIGLKGHSKKIMAAYRRGARHCMLVDKSYFGRTEYLRLSVDGFQPSYLHASPQPDDRWRRIRDEFRIEVKPKRAKGSFLIFAGSSQKYCDWHELGDGTEFGAGVCHSINKQTHSTLKLYYRPKPSWAAGHPEQVKPILDTVFSGPDVKLDKLLPGCQALVTHGSNAAVEAVINGVPAVLVSHEGVCAAWRVADKGVEKVYDPWFPDDGARLQWLADLSYCQFDLGEMKDGTAWALTAPHTMKQNETSWAGLPPGEREKAQYRVMHASNKMFRGSSIKGHIEALTDLIHRHRPATLLDYGSGKGAQYTERKVQEAWGGLVPACYDPGVPGIDVKPGGRFEGVICTDVIEHIPPETVEQDYLEAIGYATKFAFFCIYTGPSRKFLPDGRNAHLTQRPQKWWVEKTCELTGGRVEREFSVSKPIPGGGYEVFPHWAIRAASGIEVVLTFRAEE